MKSYVIAKYQLGWKWSSTKALIQLAMMYGIAKDSKMNTCIATNICIVTSICTIRKYNILRLQESEG